MAGHQPVSQGIVEQHQALRGQGLQIEAVESRVLTIPCKRPESDGTLAWDHTTMVVAWVCSAGVRGMGYTYNHAAAAQVIAKTLSHVIEGGDPMAVEQHFQSMHRAVRNLGHDGIAACAISAVDCALWDLKARLLDLPLVDLLGAARASVAVYGSGGFTSLSIHNLQDQLLGWVQAGIPRVKMKVGREPEADPLRVRAAREAIGPEPDLFVDGNGAYSRKQALYLAELFAEQGVSWFEEPVSSDDLAGLRLLRDRAPAIMDIAAGEYGYDVFTFRRMLEAGAVDVLQADITRCMGITGLRQVDALCAAHCMPLSLHCAPALHLHPAASLSQFIHLEYFHDHVRIEREVLDGLPEPQHGVLHLDRTRSGHGLTVRPAKADVYAY